LKAWTGVGGRDNDLLLMRVELESWAIQKKTGKNWDVRESLKY
jgi:hypothetical protein